MLSDYRAFIRSVPLSAAHNQSFNHFTYENTLIFKELVSGFQEELASAV